MLNEHALGPALPLSFDKATALHSFGQLVFDLFGEVLAELLAVKLHPLSLDVHLGVPAKGVRHLQEYL
jgi:hypothetical protein